MSKIRPSRRASSFTESVIREMTRLSVAHGAINLSQGFPDFPAPMELKEAARKAIADDINQYPITWGAEGFREAIAREYRTRYGMNWVDPERHVTVTCGSTEAMIAAMLGVLDPGDEVVILMPFYENEGSAYQELGERAIPVPDVASERKGHHAESRSAPSSARNASALAMAGTTPLRSKNESASRAASTASSA